MILAFKICMLILSCLFYFSAMSATNEKLLCGYTVAGTITALILFAALKML